MSSQRSEDELRRRLLLLTKRNYRSLGTYIRLIDYMVLATQVKINQESAQKILHEMQLGTARKYFVSISMLFDMDEATTDMRFNPQKSEFTQFFEKLLLDMRGTAEEVNRVTTQPDFQHHIHGLMTDTQPRFRTIVTNSFAYTTIKERIQS